MKYSRDNWLPVLIILIFGSIVLQGCHKEDVHKEGLAIDLADQPLDTIRAYIQGKWELQYAKGGIANIVQYIHNDFWEFTSNDRIVKSFIKNDKETIALDTTIMWYRDRGTYTNGDSTYIMQFYDNFGYPSNYVVDGIYEDTLVLHDFSSDAMFYHFTKL